MINGAFPRRYDSVAQRTALGKIGNWKTSLFHKWLMRSRGVAGEILD